MGQLLQYMMVKQGRAQTANTVKTFAQEIGGDDHLSDENAEDLGLILDLKNRVHTLENEKRVEKSLKLWGQMRLKIRDRKLKDREKQVANLEKELTAKESELNATRDAAERDHELMTKLASERGVPSDVDEKLSKILSTVGSMGNLQMGTMSNLFSDTEEEDLEQQMRMLKEELHIKEEQIAEFDKLREDLEDENVQNLMSHMGMLQQKLSAQKMENFRFEGRLDEIRDVLKAQAETIEGLRAQIYIILQYPKELTVSGRVGFNDNMNGVYRVGSPLHAGRVYYQHEGSAWILRWFPQKEIWIFDHRGLNTDDLGSAFVCENVEHPLLVGKNWMVFGGEDEGFGVDPEVTIHAEMSRKVSKKRGPGK